MYTIILLYIIEYACVRCVCAVYGTIDVTPVIRTVIGGEVRGE